MSESRFIFILNYLLYGNPVDDEWRAFDTLEDAMNANEDARNRGWVQEIEGIWVTEGDDIRCYSIRRLVIESGVASS